MPTYKKDPDAVLDYKFDYKPMTNGTGGRTDWLGASETITSHTITADPGITVGVNTITDSSTSVTVWLSGGSAGSSYDVTCQISTSDGRTDDRTITIAVEER